MASGAVASSVISDEQRSTSIEITILGPLLFDEQIVLVTPTNTIAWYRHRHRLSGFGWSRLNWQSGWRHRSRLARWSGLALGIAHRRLP
jgi:hypothetical protein